MLTPGLAALLVGIIVYLASASILWALVAAVIVLLVVGGGGYYSRRW